MTTLTIEGLTKRFGTIVANDAVDLRVEPGEVVGLLGHNGAGKTTIISQIVGLIRPDAGSIAVDGVDAVRDPAGARTRVALQTQGHAPLDGLTPRSAIELTARLRGLDKRHARRETLRVAGELDITAWLDRRALPDGRGISGGIRRLVAFAMAVVAPAPLVVLDEPTNDVDAGRRARLWRAVRRRADDGAGVLLVTHNVAEAERVVDQLVVLDRGRVVARGTPAQLRGTGDTDITLELRLPQIHDGRPLEWPPRQITVVKQVVDGRRQRLTLRSRDAAAAVTWASQLRAAGAVEDFSLGPTTLEDSYLAVTTVTHGQPREVLHD